MKENRKKLSESEEWLLCGLRWLTGEDRLNRKGYASPFSTRPPPPHGHFGRHGETGDRICCIWRQKWDWLQCAAKSVNDLKSFYVANCNDLSNVNSCICWIFRGISRYWVLRQKKQYGRVAQLCNKMQQTNLWNLSVCREGKKIKLCSSNESS